MTKQTAVFHSVLGLVCEDRRLKVAKTGTARIQLGIAQWLEHRTRGRGFESLQELRENFLLQGQLSLLSLISVSVPSPCYRSST